MSPAQRTLSATLNMTVPFYSRSRNLTLYRTLSVRSNVERAAGPAARDLELGACLMAVCAQERRIPALSAPPESPSHDALRLRTSALSEDLSDEDLFVTLRRASSSFKVRAGVEGARGSDHRLPAQSKRRKTKYRRESSCHLGSPALDVSEVDDCTRKCSNCAAASHGSGCKYANYTKHNCVRPDLYIAKNRAQNKQNKTQLCQSSSTNLES